MKHRTGFFDDALKEYFVAESGAYTHITAVEIDRQTFNVKSVIRNLLIDKLGRENIPAWGDKTSTIRFMLSDDLKATLGESRAISCKFSKPNKDEMTIYFCRVDLIPKMKLHVGDCWCIYFKKDDPRPWFGYIDASVMHYIQSDFIDGLCLEEDEYLRDRATGVKPLEYQCSVAGLIITEVEKPVDRVMTGVRPKTGTSNRTVSTSDMKVITSNRKIKGTRGEEIIVRAERDKLRSLHRPDLAKKVSWKSKKTDGLGYDIESFETDADGRNERKIYIEVKSTSQDEYTPFFVSRNEVAVSRKLGDNYYIYRVFNMKRDSDEVEYYRVCGSIEDHFDLTAESFSAISK